VRRLPAVVGRSRSRLLLAQITPRPFNLDNLLKSVEFLFPLLQEKIVAFCKLAIFSSCTYQFLHVVNSCTVSELRQHADQVRDEEPAGEGALLSPQQALDPRLPPQRSYSGAIFIPRSTVVALTWISSGPDRAKYGINRLWS
jgi:hypothetical protein